MSDLVARLRSNAELVELLAGPTPTPKPFIMTEAADRIEQLEALIDKLGPALDEMVGRDEGFGARTADDAVGDALRSWWVHQ